MRTALIFTLMALSAAATAGDARSSREADREAKVAADLAKTVKGLVRGDPVSCITSRSADRSRYLGDRAVAYIVSRNLVYVNTPRGGCTGLGNGRGLVTRSTTGQLCAGDFAEVRDFYTGIGYGACTLGEFVPYRKVKG